MKAVNLEGQKFGKLLVLKLVKVPGRRSWNCLCDCGRHTTECARTLTRKDSNALRACSSCRSSASKKRKPSKDVLLNRLYWLYVNSAKHRGIKFDLEYDDVLVVIQLPCHYCGRIGVRQYSKKGVGVIDVNGMDRKDSSVGYTKNNILPCCSTCNYMKHKLSYIDFLKQVSTIHNHFATSNMTGPPIGSPNLLVSSTETQTGFIVSPQQKNCTSE